MPSMDDFKQRIYQFVQDYAQCSVREFERRCNLSNGQLASIGSQGPSAMILSKMADSYPELDMNWLFRGEGSMLVSKAVETKPIPSVKHDIHQNSTVNINYTALKDIIVEAIKEAKI